MSAVPDRNSTTDLAVLGATTVGYYLVNDLVKGPRLRRAVAAGVLATGAAAAVERAQRVRADAAAVAARDAAAEAARVASEAETTGRGGTGAAEISATPPAVKLVGAAAGAVIVAAAGSWLNRRVDRAVTSWIGRAGGKIPLVGGLFRRFPSTVWGLAQFGAVLAAERLTRADAPAPAAERAESTRAGARP